MIKSILVDDEEHCLNTLEILLGEYCPQVQVLERCQSVDAAMQAINKWTPQLIFLDVELPVKNGFELLEQFTEPPFSVIFTTSYDRYAIQAIHVSALDYLLKPIESKALIAAVHKVQMQKQPPYAEQFQMLLKQLQHNGCDFKKLAVPTLEGFELIPADQILSCQADANYTYIFLKNKSKITACRALKEMEKQLQDFSSFIRIHHSYIVNLNEVIKYVRGEGGYVIMSDGSAIDVSRDQKRVSP